MQDKRLKNTKMTRIISIVGNSGSGKSVVTLNLALALANKGRDVILMDSNIYSPDIANYSDISPTIFLNEYIEGNRKIEDTLIYQMVLTLISHSLFRQLLRKNMIRLSILKYMKQF